MTTNDYDNSIIEKCKTGDFSSFRALVSRYQNRIFSVCYGLVRSRDDAADLFQEVCLRIYKSIGKVKSEAGLYVWIYRITVNVCFDWLRKKKRMRKKVDKFKAQDTVSDFFVETNTPVSIALQLELKEQINKVIAALPDAQRAVIVLREFEGLSYQEIARILKCSEGTVMSRLFYARKKMVEKLRPYLEESSA